MTIITIQCVFTLSFINSVICLNILGIFPHVGESHTFVFKQLMKGLAGKGHNVTVISFFPLEEPISNYRDVKLQIPSDATINNGRFSGNATERNLIENLRSMVRLDSKYADTKLVKYGTAMFLNSLGGAICDYIFRSETLERFLEENQQFDIFILEEFNTDCLLSLNDKFRAHVVRILVAALKPWAYQRYGNPNHPGYIPNKFLSLSDRMSFIERVENTILNTFHELYYHFVMVKSDKLIAERYLGKGAGNLDGHLRNTSLLLVNSHFTINRPRPLVPGIVEVGGIHLEKPNPLPQNIKTFIEESKHGVIYLSFGSVLKCTTMRKETLQSFQKAFSRLPQRVLWRWENETMEGKPSNVMLQKWMPQFDILNHPNVKAFISHGGLLGSIEAVHCGIPLIMIPQYGDQHVNAKTLEASGGGITLRLGEVNEEVIYKALKKVLSTSFQIQAKRLSEQFRDRPLSPLQNAIYWVEYVARHNGALHLKTAAAEMPWYQYYLIDVILFIFLLMSLLLYALYAVLKIIARCVLLETKIKTS